MGGGGERVLYVYGALQESPIQFGDGVEEEGSRSKVMCR